MTKNVNLDLQTPSPDYLAGYYAGRIQGLTLATAFEPLPPAPRSTPPAASAVLGFVACFAMLVAIFGGVL